MQYFAYLTAAGHLVGRKVREWSAHSGGSAVIRSSENGPGPGISSNGTGAAAEGTLKRPDDLSRRRNRVERGNRKSPAIPALRVALAITLVNLGPSLPALTR
jgi:hypothetical protein